MRKGDVPKDLWEDKNYRQCSKCHEWFCPNPDKCYTCNNRECPCKTQPLGHKYTCITCRSAA